MIARRELQEEQRWKENRENNVPEGFQDPVNPALDAKIEKVSETVSKLRTNADLGFDLEDV